MAAPKKLCIVFHAGDYDRVCHGLTIACVAVAMGKEAHLLFTYSALKRLVRGETDRTDSKHTEEAVAAGHMKRLTELIDMAKKLGTAQVYACSGSMALMNVSRDELIDEVDKSMGLAAFLAMWEDADVLFI